MKKTENFERISKVLQSDKLVMSEACQTLILQDFADKFNEYFELVGLPRMNLACQNGVYTVHLTFEAERIKKFNVLK